MTDPAGSPGPGPDHPAGEAAHPGDLRASVVAALDEVVAPNRGAVRAAVAEADPLRADADLAAVTDALLASIRGFGPLEAFLADERVTDVLVNGDGSVWVDRDGELRRTEVAMAPSEVALVIERVVAPLGLRCDPGAPMVDARLPDGSRVHAIIPPLAVDGPCLAIRRFRTRAVELRSFCADEVAGALEDAVAARRSIVVSGGTGAGKTTLLNALSGLIAPTERLVTIEEAAELRFRHPHVVRLESRPANAEGIGETSIRELVRAALRLRPDRIVVGECRGPEAIDMLQAMNTGHPGSMSTVHANSPDDALRRLETMTLLGGVALPLAAVREQIGSGVDLVVQVSRLGPRRRVTEVAEVDRTAAARTRRVA